MRVWLFLYKISLSLFILVERDENGELLKSMKCIKCSESYYPSSDGSKCIACRNLESNGTSFCTCPTATHAKIQDKCFEKSEMDLTNTHNLFIVEFFNDSVDSFYFRKELRSSIYLCEVCRNTSINYLWLFIYENFFLIKFDCSLSELSSNSSFVYAKDFKLHIPKILNLKIIWFLDIYMKPSTYFVKTPM